MSNENESAAVEAAPTTAVPAAPTFVGERPRFRIIPLEWPVEYDGKVYTEVTVKRLTASEVAAFIDAEDKSRLPMFDVPTAVIDGLDDDDAVEVNKAVADFLPRRWRTAEQPPNSAATTPR